MDIPMDTFHECGLWDLNTELQVQSNPQDFYACRNLLGHPAYPAVSIDSVDTGLS